MCEPATLALIAGGLGTVVSAAGQIQQGNAAKDAADYQAQVDRNNAILADRSARDARERGEQAEQEQRRKTAVLEGRQRAAFAANGVELNFGSPLDVLGDTATYGELDALTIRGNAEREGLGYEAQGMNFRSSAKLKQMQGESAKAAGMTGAFGSVLSGASSVASNWYKMKP